MIKNWRYDRKIEPPRATTATIGDREEVYIQQNCNTEYQMYNEYQIVIGQRKKIINCSVERRSCIEASSKGSGNAMRPPAKKGLVCILSGLLNPFYPRPLIVRICLIPSQCEAFRYQGRMSNFNFSHICIFGGNTVHTRSCYLAVCGSLHTSVTEVTRSCYYSIYGTREHGIYLFCS